MEPQLPGFKSYPTAVDSRPRFLAHHLVKGPALDLSLTGMHTDTKRAEGILKE